MVYLDPRGLSDADKKRLVMQYRAEIVSLQSDLKKAQRESEAVQTDKRYREQDKVRLEIEIRELERQMKVFDDKQFFIADEIRKLQKKINELGG